MPSRTLRVSKRNSAFQILESLGSNRQQRHKNRSFLVEGVQPINTALEHQWEFEALIYEGGAVLSGWASHVLKRASPALLYEVSKELLAQLSGKVETSELMAVLKMPEEDPGRIPHRKDMLVVVMDRPSNPGNLGTLIRSCDAFGVDGLIIPSGSAAGTFYLIAKADADNAISETLETNNTRSRSIIIGPDLIVSTVTVSSSSVPAGALVNVTDTVVNQGAEIASASTTRFYLSKNTSLDASDVALAPGRSVPTLAAGASNAGTTPVTIPLGTVPGSYYVLAKADGDGVVGESLETNNVTARALQVTIAP